MNRQIIFLFIGLLTAVGLTACTPESVEMVRPTRSIAEATAAPTPEIVVPTAELMTPSPYPEVNEITATLISSFVEPPLTVSPDGRWRVTAQISTPVTVDEEEMEQFPSGAKYLAELWVESTAGDLVWSVIDEWRNSGLGFTYPAPLHWSADGRYLYYSNVPTVDGCAAFVNGGDLWRLDLTDGTMTELLPYMEMVLALSPDSQQVAYHRAFGGGFYLRDLATGAETPFDLPDHDDSWQVGGLTWSPDGQQILLTQVLNPCGESLTAVIRLDLTDNSLSTLIPPDERNFTFLNWVGDREMGLLAEDVTVWYLETATGEIVDGSPQD